MKKLMCAIIALIIVMQSAAVFSAENKTAESAQSETESILKQSVILMPGEKYCFVNGEFKTVGDVAPVIESGRTLVPARFLSEALNGSASWNDKTKTATLVCENKTVDIPIGKSYITVDGKNKELDVGGSIINSRTVLPLRGICEALGKNVDYDTGLIIINDSKLENKDAKDISLRKALLKCAITGMNKTPSYDKTSDLDTKLKNVSGGYISMSDIPFESAKNKLMKRVGDLYIENIGITEKNADELSVKMDIYNTSCSYAAIEIYDANNSFVKSRLIEPFAGQKADVSAVLDTAHVLVDMTGAAITGDISNIEYRSSYVSKHNSADLTVPKGGYILIAVNPNESDYVLISNMLHIGMQTISTTKSWSSMISKANIPDDDTYKEKVIEKFTSKLIAKGVNGAALITDMSNTVFKPDNMWDYMDYSKNLAQKCIDFFNVHKEEFGEALTETLDDALSSVEAAKLDSAKKMIKDILKEDDNLLPVVGSGFKWMDAIANSINLTDTCVEYALNSSRKSYIIFFKNSTIIKSSMLAESNGIICNASGYDIPTTTHLYITPAMPNTYVCSVAIYRNKIYYACKESGTSDYDSAIYSCNLDGSGHTLILRDFNGRSQGYTDFCISGDKLFCYDYQTVYSYDINSGATERLTGLLPKSSSFMTADENYVYYTAYEKRAYKPYKINIKSKKTEACSDNSIYFKKTSPVISNVNYYSDKKSIHKLSGGEDTVIYNGSDIEKIHLVSGDYLYFSEHFKNSTRTEEYTALSRINLKTNVKEPLYSHRAAGSGYFFGW